MCLVIASGLQLKKKTERSEVLWDACQFRHVCLCVGRNARVPLPKYGAQIPLTHLLFYFYIYNLQGEIMCFHSATLKQGLSNTHSGSGGKWSGKMQERKCTVGKRKKKSPIQHAL